jgi:AraC-like DNA-binding protein
MAIIFHTPSPPLNYYINTLYYPDGSSLPPREKILPLPALDLKINFGGTFQVYREDHGEPFAAVKESWVLGLWSTSHIVDWPLDVQYIGVSFKPGRACLFLQIPLSELQNQVVSLDAIWGGFAAEIRERLYLAPTIQARFALLEELLLARLREAPQGLKAVQYAVGELAQYHGALSIRELSNRLGMSQKHLITQFRQMVGCTPKELGRLYRFDQVLDSIDPIQPVDWTLVAHQFCYHDQSHFIRDFKEFTGHTPSDYLRLRRQMQDEYPDRAKITRLLPIG